ncbi:hypothetical protein Nepgr_008600 [Nepenthes gracilis]|uniref:RNA helicase n=1 Tax=Nepenthes gracilis TaxID=150966 RepID=A0AAD3S9C8_NEPGR|nr:hypothetical protein Nepgr_008600 [Nepenthes gracilis]
MAPKKRQQRNKPQSSSTDAPKLRLSSENEQRIRRLLINNPTAGNSPRPASIQADEWHSFSRAQKAKKLKAIYEKLSCEGFSNDHIELALSVLKVGATFEAALDWLCLNLSRRDLPCKYSDGSSLPMNGGDSVGVISTAQEDWTPSMGSSAGTEEEVREISVRIKGHADDISYSHEPSQADWIRQYMEKEEEIDIGSWEDNLSDEGSSKKATEPRSLDSIVNEYQDARLEAITAKEKGDKRSQERASSRIRILKQEMSALGLSHDMLTIELGKEVPGLPPKYVTCSSMACEHPVSSISCQDEVNLRSGSRVHGNVMEHCRSEEMLVELESLNIPSKEKADLEAESGDIELGNFFLEDGTSNEVLAPEIFKIQKKEKARVLFSDSTIEKLEGIWKKGDPRRIPKAVLHQLCQKSGWDPPKFDKMGRRGDGFSYTVSIIRKSSGRGKSRKAGGLITLELPELGGTFLSAEEAQNRVAAFALYRLFPELPIHLLITEPYASLVAQWEGGGSLSEVEESQEDRRAGFVDSLLDIDCPKLIHSIEINSNFDKEFQQLPFPDFATAARPKGHGFKEKESSFLRRQLENKRKLPRYKCMLESRAALPIAKSKDEILQLLKQYNVLVVCGETGSGKTTQVPQYILDDMIESGCGGACNIICTQPRRIAAISVAERVADERCEPSPGLDGSFIGYQVRLDSSRNDTTKLLFCTTGILLRRIAGDKDLVGISHVIVDEVHERSLLGDFLLIVLKNLLEKQSSHGTPMLKVILMSATVDSSLFSCYFGDCPVITAEGRTHPVSTYFLEDIYERINYRLASDSPAFLSFEPSRHEILVGPVNNRKGKNLVSSSLVDESLLSDECTNQHYIPTAYQAYSEQTRLNLKRLNEDVIDYDLLEDLVCHIDETYGDGAILVFLPGVSEIYTLLDRLAASYCFGGESSEWLLPLHSSIAAPDQKKVFLKPPKNIRKVIIATNIAETSLTIDDVVYVIDSGKHNENRYNPRKKLSSMVEDWISQANAKQRRGRAGRVKPGICFCLYTRHRFENVMRQFQVPEILRMPLVELCLQIKLLSLGNIKSFLSKALEPPKEEAVDSAISLLREVGAIEETEDLTPLGKHLAKLPVDLLLGKMLLYAAIFGCLSPILSISAILSYKSPFVQPKNERESIEKLKLAVLTDKLEGSTNPRDSDRQSDHIVMMVAYRKWEKIFQEKGVKQANNFCSLYSLSSSVMYMIRDMRKQFGTLLADIGLINLPKDYQIPGKKKRNLDGWLSDAAQPFNKYAHHSAVVKAILCAGLYPNVAAAVEGIYAPALGNLRQSLQPTTKGYTAWYDRRSEVHIHRSSVNSGLKAFQYPFLVFHEKVEINKVFLRDSTIVSPYSLLLFGGSINIQHQLGVVTIDGWLKLSAAAQTAVLFKELRITLDSVLKGLISNPEKIAVDDQASNIMSVEITKVDHTTKQLLWLTMQIYYVCSPRLHKLLKKTTSSSYPDPVF